jgi:hypothetical protein
MSVIVLTLALAVHASEASDRDLAEKAENAFAEGLRLRERNDRGVRSFRAAAGALEELRHRGISNALLYRDLGNAHLLAGDLPRAILAYRQGLRLHPSDRILREALAGAREQVVFAEGSVVGRPAEILANGWWMVPGPGALFLAAALAYAGACICLTRWRMVRREKFLVAGLVFAALAVPPTWVSTERWRVGPPRPIVVLSRNGVLLRKGNGLMFPPWFDTPLMRGVEAELVFQRDGWLQIELPGGEIGWVRAADAVVEDVVSP